MALPKEFHDLAAKVRNWGRWGDDDEVGTVNFVTPQVLTRAAACVKVGKSFSLALPLHLDGPQIGVIPGRVNPLKTMVAINTAVMGDPDGFRTSDDVVTMGLQCATHWDGLGHVSYGGKIYNGFDAATIDEWGAHKCGIEKIKTFVSRGVLLDVARSKGVDLLESGYAITPTDLEDAAKMANLTVESGDIVLIRTGRMKYLHEGDKMAYLAGKGDPQGSPGPSLATVPWFHDHEVAAVATDTLTFEVFPSENPQAMLAIHLLHLVDMGMTQGQNWDLEVLAEDCAGDGVYQFFLDASPQPFVGGVGSPVNPVAIK
ncbi:MAG: cyclase family protein [Chloroflexi bacterium]|nr:cyclase family protein [Chloroflexota bacterium]